MKIINKKSLVMTVLAIGLSSSAFAHHDRKSALIENAPSLDRVFVHKENVSFDGMGGSDIDGFSIGGSKRLSKHTFVFGEGSKTSEKIDNLEYDFDRYSVGLGYTRSINHTTNIYAGVSYEQMDSKVVAIDSGSKITDTNTSGHGFQVGMKHMYYDLLEVDGKIYLRDYGDVEHSGVEVGANYFIQKDLSVGINYENNSDYEQYGFGLAFHF